MSEADRQTDGIVRLITAEAAHVRDYFLESPLVTSFSKRSDAPAIGAANIPSGLGEFWGAFSEARLLEDCVYGQMGLLLVSYESSLERSLRDRESGWLCGDEYFIGKFLGGDHDLIYSADDQIFRISEPIDWRKDWFSMEGDLEMLVGRYIDSCGDWECW